MEKQEKKRILLAFDGSAYALDAVRYVSRTLTPQNTEVVLFHVHHKIPEHYWDLKREASPAWRMNEVAAWEREQEKTVEESMDKATKILWRADFPKASVEVRIHNKEKGISRDIIKEAERGYSCVVAGRKGISELKDLCLGSIANKLIEKLVSHPVLVVGKKPKPGALLLALDGSENSMRTVDFVGGMLGRSDLEASLIHVIRGDNKVYTDAAKQAITPVFEEAKSRLAKYGFEPNQITTRIVTGAHSRAGAILEEAKMGGYGTIVVGRRGLSEVLDFFMGRVSNKIVHMAKEQAVWVVS
jgi:nucleotide-binding universal stress UspA family protein